MRFPPLKVHGVDVYILVLERFYVHFSNIVQHEDNLIKKKVLILNTSNIAENRNNFHRTFCSKNLRENVNDTVA